MSFSRKILRGLERERESKKETEIEKDLPRWCVYTMDRLR